MTLALAVLDLDFKIRGGGEGGVLGLSHPDP